MAKGGAGGRRAPALTAARTEVVHTCRRLLPRVTPSTCRYVLPSSDVFGTHSTYIWTVEQETPINVRSSVLLALFFFFFPFVSFSLFRPFAPRCPPTPTHPRTLHSISSHYIPLPVYHCTG